MQNRQMTQRKKSQKQIYDNKVKNVRKKGKIMEKVNLYNAGLWGILTYKKQSCTPLHEGSLFVSVGR